MELKYRIIAFILSIVTLIIGVGISIYFVLAKNSETEICNCDNKIYLLISLISLSSGILISIILKKNNLFNQNEIKKIKNNLHTKSKLDFDNYLDEFNNNYLTEFTDKTQNDTVIVPVRKTLHEVLSEKKYRCKLSRKFTENIKYIAFYSNKKIFGYGEISERNIVGDVIEYSIKNFTEKIIHHNEKWAYVQNKRYCKLEILLNANSTSEINKNEK